MSRSLMSLVFVKYGLLLVLEMEKERSGCRAGATFKTKKQKR